MEQLSPSPDQNTGSAAQAEQPDTALLEAGRHVVGATAELLKSAGPEERKELMDELKGQLREAGVEVTDVQQEEIDQQGLTREERRHLFLQDRENILRGRKPEGKRPPVFGRLLR